MPGNNKRFLKSTEKMFPDHLDNHQYIPDMAVAVHEVKDAIEKGIQEAVEALGERPFPVPHVNTLYRKHKAQFNDPICTYALLEMLIYSQRQIYLRPHYLIPQLQLNYPQYHWTNQIVGRMLAGLQEVCYMAYYPSVEPKETPFSRGRDAKGNYYIIDPKNGNEGLFWLVIARQKVLRRVIDLMRSEASGHMENSLWSSEMIGGNQPADCYADIIGEFRIRSIDNHQAQWEPGRRYSASQERMAEIKHPKFE